MKVIHTPDKGNNNRAHADIVYEPDDVEYRVQLSRLPFEWAIHPGAS
jgi:hypothetical protein